MKQWAVVLAILLSLLLGGVLTSCHHNPPSKIDLIHAALNNDTAPNGAVNTDSITSDPTIKGRLISRRKDSKPTETISTLKARFQSNDEFTDITSFVQTNGDFLLDRSILEQIKGGPLDDGPYALRLEAEDDGGTTLDSIYIAFTLDTTSPVAVLFEPWDGGVSNLQLGYVDVVFLDESSIEPTTLKSENISVNNENITLNVLTPIETSDGLYRYEYEGKLEEGLVNVSFKEGQISDIAGNVNSQRSESFEFVNFPERFNSVPQRPRRIAVQPNINPPHNEDSGGSVYLHSGEAFLKRVDLEIPGRGLDWSFERTYRSGWTNYETPLGHNWDFNYNRRLFVVASGPTQNPEDITFNECRNIYDFQNCFATDVIRMDGGREDLFRRNNETSNPNDFLSPSGFYTQLTERNGVFTERYPDGKVITYQKFNGSAPYLMSRIRDRNGNTMRFVYNDSNQLISVLDPYLRRIDYSYDDENHLIQVKDFIGRTITFEYDNNDDLVAVTGPRVNKTPTGNVFPEGKTEKYTYSTSSNPILRHNLLTVTAPNEVASRGMPKEVYIYDRDDRVVEQKYGGINNNGVQAGGSFTYQYLYANKVRGVNPALTSQDETTPTPVSDDVDRFKFTKTNVVDRNGNETRYSFSRLGNATVIDERTNRDVRPSEPINYVQKSKFDDDGQRLTITYPEGNTVDYTFNDTETDRFPGRFQQGNLLEVTRRPDTTRSGDQSDIQTSYTYEPIYNQIRTITDARGTDPNFRPPIELSFENFPNQKRYTQVQTFDYQEGNNFEALAQELGTTPTAVRELLEDADIQMGLGDINGDGITNQIAGNVIRTEHPRVKLLANSNLAALEGDTNQDIFELFTYNNRGQILKSIDPEGNSTTFLYYSSRDPDGDGIGVNVGPGPFIGGAGYLRLTEQDSNSDAARNSGTNPAPARIQNTYRYDPVGNIVQEVDGRGIQTNYIVNELNQIVQIEHAADHISLPEEQLPLENFRYIERFWYDFNNNKVLHQKEDRGNTSNVAGNLIDISELPVSLPALNADFEDASDGEFPSYEENGILFEPRAPAALVSLLSFTPFEGMRKRGVQLRADSKVEAIRISRVNGAPFSNPEVRVQQLPGSTDVDEWRVISPKGGSEILPFSGPIALSGSEWSNIDFFDIISTKNTGRILLDDLRILISPDSIGSSQSFADEATKYDILDNPIETIQEVENGDSPHFLTTKYRYDANENLVLTIFPEGNAKSKVYDERDLLFRSSRGALTPGNQLERGTSTPIPGGVNVLRDATKSWTENEWVGRTVWIVDGPAGRGQARTIVANTDTLLTVSPSWSTVPLAGSTYEISLTLLASDDPTNYDVNGGLTCDCTSYFYDGNRNVIETVDASDTDLSNENNNTELGPGDRTRYVYDGFDRLVSTIDSVGNQMVYQYDPVDNRVRELHFGPTGGPSPTTDGPTDLPGPVSIQGTIRRDNLINTNLLAAREYVHDELSRPFQVDQVLFVNTTPTVHSLDVSDGAADIGKESLTPGDDQGISEIGDIEIIGRVTTRSEFDRKSRPSFTVEDDGDVSQIFYDGVDRIIKTVGSEGNTVESVYDDGHNLIEQRQIDVAQGIDGEAILESGQSTGSNSVRTLNDIQQDWLPFEWSGHTLKITGGVGEGQVRSITTNTSSLLRISSDWDTTPDNTSTYAILPLPILDSGKASARTTEDKLADLSQDWTEDQWKGRFVEVTGGTGVGQVRIITSNDSLVLTVEPNWDVSPDISSRYVIYEKSQPGIAEIFLTTSEYDSLNRLRSQTDNLGQTTNYRYDSRDNLVAMADAQGPLTGNAINRRGFSDGLLTVNNINDFGNVTLYYFDGINRQTQQEIILTTSGSGDGEHIGASIEGVKNDPNDPEASIPMADILQGGGDGLIRMGTIYDDNSRISAQIDDQGNVSLYLYDNIDRKVVETKGLTTSTSPLTKTTILGNREIVTPTIQTINNPAVIPLEKVNAQLGAAQTQLEKVTPLFPPLADQVDDNPPTSTVYGYDPDGNLLEVEDENDSEVFIRYDAINRPIALRVFRAGQRDSHLGDSIFAPNPANDAANPSVQFPQAVVGTTKQNYQYDGLSRLVMTTDNNDPVDSSDNSSVSYAFDSLNRLLEESQQIGSLEPQVISTGWRAENLRSKLTYPNKRNIGYTYDELDRINTIADEGATDNLVDYNYIGIYRPLERLYPINNTRMTYLDNAGTSDIGYDGLRRQIRSRNLKSDNSEIVGFGHTYDRMNNKTGEDKLHGPTNNEQYSYDSAYRLNTFNRPDIAAIPPQHNSWDLDGAGNWTNVNGGTETREHSSFNEITTRGVGGTPVSLAYDDNGNLTDNNSNSYAWDFSNRLHTVTRLSDEQPIGEYNYDAIGRRIRKIVANSGSLDGTTIYYYDAQQVIEEKNAADLLVQQYVYGNYIDEPLVLDRNLDTDNSAIGLGDQRLFYHQNNLMNVYALTDPNSTIVEGALYDAYGRNAIYQPGSNGTVDFGGDDEITSGEPSKVNNPYLFTGRRFDSESGLYFYRNRYFDKDLGRFISRDLEGCWGDRRNLGNGYTYVGNNSLNYSDPLGLEETIVLPDETIIITEDKPKSCPPGYESFGGECFIQFDVGEKALPGASVYNISPIYNIPKNFFYPVPQITKKPLTPQEKKCSVCLSNSQRRASGKYKKCMKYYERLKSGIEGGGDIPTASLLGTVAGGVFGFAVGGPAGAVLFAKFGAGYGTGAGVLHVITDNQDCVDEASELYFDELRGCKRYECKGHEARFHL